MPNPTTVLYRAILRRAKLFDDLPVLKTLLTTSTCPSPLEEVVSAFTDGAELYAPPRLLPQSAVKHVQIAFRTPLDAERSIEVDLDLNARNNELEADIKELELKEKEAREDVLQLIEETKMLEARAEEGQIEADEAARVVHELNRKVMELKEKSVALKDEVDSLKERFHEVRLKEIVHALEADAESLVPKYQKLRLEHEKRPGKPIPLDTGFMGLRYLNTLVSMAERHCLIDAEEAVMVRDSTMRQTLGENHRRTPRMSRRAKEVVRLDTAEAGTVLIAHPLLTGEFARTVVLLCSHNDATGSYGLCLNRPMSIPLKTYLDCLPFGRKSKTSSPREALERGFWALFGAANGQPPPVTGSSPDADEDDGLNSGESRGDSLEEAMQPGVEILLELIFDKGHQEGLTRLQELVESAPGPISRKGDMLLRASDGKTEARDGGGEEGGMGRGRRQKKYGGPWLGDLDMHWGGPVHGVQMLHTLQECQGQPVELLPHGESFRLGVDYGELGRVAKEPRPKSEQLRMFAGESIWEPGQLENELRQHTWLVAGAPAQLLGLPWRRGGREGNGPNWSSGDQMWQTLLRELGGECADMASISQDLADEVMSLGLERHTRDTADW